MQRDLACEELWAQSLARSRAQREAAAAAPGVKLPARSLSVAALVAVSGATVAGVTAIQAGSADQAVAAVVKSRGSDVRELQRKLGVPADGVFGPVTERALKRWQRAHGLVADGIAGPNTRAAMGLGAGPVLKRKAGGKRSAQRSHGHSRRGGGVRALQRRIGVPADGVFGPATEAALSAGSARTACLPTASPDPTRAPSSASVPDRSSSAAGRARRRQRFIDAEGRDPCRQPDREPPLQVRRWPRQLPRLGLRLLGVSLLRPSRGRAAALAARLGRLHALRSTGPRPLHHDLRQPRSRLHGRERAPLRHERALRDGGSRWTSTMRSSSGYVVRHPRGF